VPETATAPASRSKGTGKRAHRGWDDFLARYTLVFILVAMIIGFSIGNPDTFFTWRNFKTILDDQVVILLLAVGVVAPFIVGEFDLSIGYVLGLAQAFVVGFLAKSGMPIPLAIALTLAMCAVVGLISGFIVVKGQVSSLITTLGVGSVVYGFVYAYTGGQVLYQGVPKGFLSIAREDLFGIPLPVWYAAVIVLVLELFFVFSGTGRRLFAIGGNRAAATLSGVRVKPLIVMTFMISAVLAGVAGILLASRIGTAQADTGPSLLLPAFAAVFLGATTIRPGHFNVLGTVVAVYALAVPITGLQQIGVPSWFELVFNGAALVIAVAASKQLDLLRERRARRARLRAFREDRETGFGKSEIGGPDLETGKAAS
jgi:ribose transport system permease protein